MNTTMKFMVFLIVIILSENSETSSFNIYTKCLDTRVYCMSLPESCVQQNISCNILLIAAPVIDSHDGSVEFELLGRVDQSSRWFAMGLSFDQQMGSDSVTEIFISNDGENKQMRQSWNDGESNQVIAPVKGITQIGNITYSDGILRGKWRRNAVTTVKDNKFDISTKKFYILLAEGPLDDTNNKQYHSQKSISQSEIDLQSTPSDAMKELYKKCSTTNMLCFGITANCMESKNCELILGITSSGYGLINGTVEFELIGKAGEGKDIDQWIAMGLSDDNKMGNDSVVECVVFKNGTTKFRNSWNDGHSNDVINNVVGVVSTGNVSYDNGLISCKWIRLPYTKVKDTTYDLIDDSYYILLAKGKLANEQTGEKKIHSKRFVSQTFVDLQSDTHQFTTAPNTTTRETTTARMITSTETPSNLTQAYKRCFNKERVCFGFPAKCIDSKDCKVLLSSLSVSKLSGDVEMELFWSRDSESENRWVAMALSKRKLMGENSVTECILEKNGTVSIRQGWNPHDHAQTQTVDVKGIQAISGSNVDGVLYCKWRRNGITFVKENTFNILNDTFYLLLAYGPMDSGDNIAYHEGRIISDTQVDLQSDTQFTTAPTQETTTARMITSTETPSTLTQAYKRCFNKERLCFGLPAKCVDSKDCKVLLSSLSVSKLSGDVEMELFWSRDSKSENRWVAMALSKRKLMGENSVTECILSKNGTVSIKQGWNPQDHTQTQTVDMKGIQTMSGSNVDGVLYCKWRRNGITIVKENTFNILNDTFYLLLAYGPMGSGDNIAYHEGRVISDTEIDLQSVGVVSAAGVSILIKLHGTFMIIAWLGCVSISIIMARHYKNAWPNSTLCGVKIWFAIHRALMLISVILIIVASILIVSYRKGWTGASAHPILGVIAISLSILQPIGSIFRPNPNSSKRWIFNWAHWFVGNTAHIISFITILLACNFTNVLPTQFAWIMISYAIYYVISHLIHHLQTYMANKKEANYVLREDKDQTFMNIRVILNSVIISGFVITFITLIFI